MQQLYLSRNTLLWYSDSRKQRRGYSNPKSQRRGSC
jgi:hypothetical protein